MYFVDTNVFLIYSFDLFVEWYWWCCIHPRMLQALSIITGVLSIIIVWSEMTFFKKQPVLSIFALMVKVAKQNNDYVMIQVIK